MNKFLLLTLSVLALGFAAPAIADDHGMHADTEVEVSVDGVDADAATDVTVEVCSDAEGNEIECPAEEDMSHEHDTHNHEAHDDMGHSTH